MILTPEARNEIKAFVTENLSDWIVEKALGKSPVVFEIELRERIVRVEEELKNQRELMQQGFALMEKRFEQVDKRFEQMEKRFEQMENRFEQSDRRFESLSQRLDRFMLWSFGITFTATALIISAIKLW
jgi:predicted nuclease with TOPRIM domain